MRIILIGIACVAIVSSLGYFFFVLKDRDSIISQESIELKENELKSVDFSSFSSTFLFSAKIPVQFEIEYIPEVKAVSVYDPSLSNEDVREKSQIYITSFEANRFLTLSTIELTRQDNIMVGGREAVKYEITKKQGVPDFAHQPSWRNTTHTAIDVRFTKNSPSLFYPFARNPALSEEVFNDFINSLVFHSDKRNSEVLEAQENMIAPTPASTTEQPTSTAVQKQTCVSNSAPVFTNHITDISMVTYVAPPPTMGAGPSLKTHGYIGTNGIKVPVYAPTALRLKAGSYYTGGPYMFDFEVSCEVTVRFGHMTNPVDSIKKLLPSEPQLDSRTQELSPVSFAAGDLIGYTTGTDAAGNWDFGVYNSSRSNRYANDPNWNNSTVYTTAVCPFDYFASNLKVAYTAKFNSEVMAGNPPHGESFCQ